jgi:hypothetical protein
VPNNAEPVIASYVKDGWVFVATKVRRDKPDNEPSTPHPLSFTFKTDKPVYPMRLTGLNSQSLMVDLYVFCNACAAAPHFKLKAAPGRTSFIHCCTNGLAIQRWSPSSLRHFHPLTCATMFGWNRSPFLFEQKNRLFSRQGAMTTALNWGVGAFCRRLIIVCLLAFANEKYKTKLPRRIGVITLAGIVLVALIYLSLPKIEVKLVKGRFYSYEMNNKLLFASLWVTLTGKPWPKFAPAFSKPSQIQPMQRIMA